MRIVLVAPNANMMEMIEIDHRTAHMKKEIKKRVIWTEATLIAIGMTAFVECAIHIAHRKC